MGGLITETHHPAVRGHHSNYAQMTDISGFYVYRLVDPGSSLPFYVGKGQRRRAWWHQAVIANGGSSGNERKDNKIRTILGRGQDVKVEIVACYRVEADALDHEFRLVDANPTLTNIVPGGGGNPIVAEKRRQRLQVLRARKLAEAVGRARAKLHYSQAAVDWLPRVVSPTYDSATFDRRPKAAPTPKYKKGGTRRKRRAAGILTA